MISKPSRALTAFAAAIGVSLATSGCIFGGDEEVAVVPAPPEPVEITYRGSGYHDPYWGWYGGDYYPGTGTYVYDRDRRPRRWDDGQKAFWQNRQRAWQQGLRDNWDEFHKGGPAAAPPTASSSRR